MNQEGTKLGMFTDFLCLLNCSQRIAKKSRETGELSTLIIQGYSCKAMRDVEAVIVIFFDSTGRFEYG